ncbi:hypothetical protein BCV72DRAFT_322211 [Rhizopus microsporus var. microsporus]|uniref:Uncharacterized protein n=1 Tax=Rhizopus microsporus var. microsporus TaxID=86635 RepID=A0A1X0QNG3_RHIZD|nr:hypothetical protein BCV72DRAFT_322211 [Rhizopus microsporus var. microsporus]
MQIANPLSEDTRLVVEYLSFLSRYSKSHLNSIRPGLVPVYNVVHSERGGLVNDIFAQEFFKSVRNIKIQILNKYQEVWDPLLVITSIKENWAVNTNLLLDILQKKPSFCFAWGLSDDQNRIWGDYNVGISTFTLLTQLQDQQG